MRKNLHTFLYLSSEGFCAQLRTSLPMVSNDASLLTVLSAACNGVWGAATCSCKNKSFGMSTSWQRLGKIRHAAPTYMWLQDMEAFGKGVPASRKLPHRATLTWEADIQFAAFEASASI